MTDVLLIFGRCAGFIGAVDLFADNGNYALLESIVGAVFLAVMFACNDEYQRRNS